MQFVSFSNQSFYLHYLELKKNKKKTRALLLHNFVQMEARHINYCHLQSWKFYCYKLYSRKKNVEILEPIILFRAVLIATFITQPAHLTVDGSLQLWIAGFIELDSWKEVLDQAQEERLVFIDLNKHRGWEEAKEWMLIIVVWPFYK